MGCSRRLPKSSTDCWGPGPRRLVREPLVREPSIREPSGNVAPNRSPSQWNRHLRFRTPEATRDTRTPKSRAMKEHDMHPVATILVARECRDIRRLHPQNDVWQVVWSGLLSRSRRARMARVESCRADVLRELLSGGPLTFIQHEDAPKDYDVPGVWVSHGDKTWVVPPAFMSIVSAEHREWRAS